MHVLLIEPYCGGSHEAWAKGYAVHSRHRVTLLSMPASFWKWRMQGAALTLAEQVATLPTRPDVLLASDMLNLPTFLGLTRGALADVPVAMYCHENQLTYPCPPGEARDLTYGMINWLSMIAADRVIFNSAFHRDDWFAEVPRLLSHFPDFTHSHRIPEVWAKSTVLPVGCDLRRFDQTGSVVTREMDQPPLILWNQRWEYDKDPQTFFDALDRLADEGIAFRVALAGQCTRQTAPEFDAARERLGARVVHFGHADRAVYAALLQRSDVVVSTAVHEFFGVAVVEAIYCGCFPVLPQRLAYPELIPSASQSACMYGDFEGLVARLRWALLHREQAATQAAELRSAVVHFDWSEVAPRYDAELAAS